MISNKTGVHAATKERVSQACSNFASKTLAVTLLAKLFIIDAAILFQHVSLEGTHQIARSVIE